MKPQSVAERRIVKALSRNPRGTDFYRWAAGCSLGEAVEILLRLESRGVAERVPKEHTLGTIWRAVA